MSEKEKSLKEQLIEKGIIPKERKTIIDYSTGEWYAGFNQCLLVIDYDKLEEYIKERIKQAN